MSSGMGDSIPATPYSLCLSQRCNVVFIYPLSDLWPQHRPLPQDYVIEFSDGCIPPNLHNSSDSPANFPTLDTLPREQRGAEYSDAYDGDQTEETSKLMINPAVMAAVASKASAVVRRPVSVINFLYTLANNIMLAITINILFRVIATGI